MIVRQVTRESADEYEYVRFFPDALTLDLRRMPSRDGLTRAFLTEGFGRGLSTRSRTLVRVAGIFASR